MKRVISTVLSAFLVAITFLTIPALTSQANAETLIAASDSYTVDKATVKRIQQKAEDLGDRPDRRIGDTGLENIREMGENIPETLEMRARQDSRDALNSNQRKALKDAQNQVKGAVEGTKRAVKDALD